MQVTYACNYVCYDYITIYVDLASCSLDTQTSVISMYFDSRASQLDPPVRCLSIVRYQWISIHP